MFDYKLFQELMRRMGSALELPVETVRENRHRLLDLLHTVVPDEVVLVDPAELLWQTLTSIPPRSKKADCHQVPIQCFEQFFSHLVPRSLVVAATNEWSTQQQRKSTLRDKESKNLDLLGRKSYSIASLQVRILDYQI